MGVSLPQNILSQMLGIRGTSHSIWKVFQSCYSEELGGSSQVQPVEMSYTLTLLHSHVQMRIFENI